MYTHFFKRILDFIFSLVGLILLSPIFLFVFILLLVNNKGAALFFQLRPGKDGKIFKIIKFKTMNDKKDSVGNLLPDSVRLTKLGQFIRKTSLDEIPQLINVVKGDMSLIGPRPLLPEYLSFYSEQQNKRHNIKPGITGWAQVNGRNAITWERKFELDVWYVENSSFLLDLKIIFMTLVKVIKSEDISPMDKIIMPRFSEWMKQNKR